MKEFTLENNPKIASGFQVPENYFDDFDDKLLSKLETQPTIKPIFKHKKYWFMSIAAVFVLFFGTTIFYQVNDNDSNTNYVVEDLVHDTSISTDDLAEQLTDKDFEAIENTLQIN